MTTPSEGPPVGLLLRLAHVRARDLFTAALRPLGLKSYHYGALLVLRREGPCSQRQLAEEMATDKSTMVRLLDDLENAGLVTRTPVPADRRTHAITLTDEGRAMIRKAGAVVAKTQEELLEGFSDAERRTLQELLVRFTGYKAS
ncbi:MarR family winged helix-turn-helix transcriptional regulator [Actinomadura gamaensis]|uniref:MarR family winged helix-turn-helix transcriptional regulator n=1 Tax=Actinomadura gamaensis TaxID=1763541 RepID=A0ABV9TPW4_9ACTN